MKRPVSLTLRLTLLFTVAAMIGFLGFGWIIERSLENLFASEDIDELKVVAQAVEGSIFMLQDGSDPAFLKQRFDDILVGHHAASLHINDATGKPIYSSPEPNFSLMPPPSLNHFSQAGIRQWNDGKHNYRVLIQQVNVKNDAPYTAIITVVTDHYIHFLHEFRRTLWWVVISGIAVMGLMGWIAVRHGHRPLHHIVDQISRISANKLNTRLDPGAVPAELTELALSFNELLQRMEEAFNRISNFSADIAHELRTPVTNLITQSQVTLSQARSVEEYQEILYSNMEEYERMAQMIEDMLFLAKADNGLHPPNREEINLKDELYNLFDYYEAWAEERHIAMTLDGTAHIQGDRLMLRRALSNLLSNAIRHTPAGDEVQIRLRHSKNSVMIIVQNPGLPLSTEQCTKVFDRFYRTDPSRQRSGEGAGLGLAIVKSIIKAHGGAVMVTSNKTNTQFRINLPITNGHSTERTHQAVD